MTRLITDWLKEPEESFKKYDEKLKKLIGMDIPALAYHAAGLPPVPTDVIKVNKTAVVRFSTGEGVIGSFAESVATVVRHMGADVFIPEECDVTGIYEALSGGAEILFMADDERFIAVNVKTGSIAENDHATALGYVSGLSVMAGGLAGKEVLQLGYGRVGKIALDLLINDGARVKIFDLDRAKTARLDNEKVLVLSEPPLPLSGLILDLTNEGGWLGMKDIADDAKISAPGVPLSLDDEAYCVYQDRVLHDPLQLGTAVMFAMTIKGF